jgi:hypothetical protein
MLYLLKDNKPDKNDTYIIHKIEIIKGGNSHDGFDETHMCSINTLIIYFLLI